MARFLVDVARRGARNDAPDMRKRKGWLLGGVDRKRVVIVREDGLDQMP